jgi:hypothetical protein
VLAQRDGADDERRDRNEHGEDLRDPARDEGGQDHDNEDDQEGTDAGEGGYEVAAHRRITCTCS